eukprot:6000843-Pleurochrysis_carterae.AAC.1
MGGDKPGPSATRPPLGASPAPAPAVCSPVSSVPRSSPIAAAIAAPRASFMAAGYAAAAAARAAPSAPRPCATSACPLNPCTHCALRNACMYGDRCYEHAIVVNLRTRAPIAHRANVIISACATSSASR